MTTIQSPKPSTEPIDAIATFVAARRELLGTDPLIGAAELARSVCRGAQQTISVFAVTHARMRRLDGWLDHQGFVTQAAARSDRDPVIGSLSNRVNTTDVLTKVVHALVGDCPDQPSDAPVTHDLSTLGTASMPVDADWFVLVFVGDRVDTPFVRGVGATSVGGQLAVAEFTSIAAPVEFRGATAQEWNTVLASTVRAATPSLAELLATDPSR